MLAILHKRNMHFRVVPVRTRETDTAYRVRRANVVTVFCCLSALLLCGCAGAAPFLLGSLAAEAVRVAAGGSTAPREPSPEDLAVAGMDGSPIDYPITVVYRGLIHVAEVDGRKIVATDMERIPCVSHTPSRRPKTIEAGR